MARRLFVATLLLLAPRAFADDARLQPVVVDAPAPTPGEADRAPAAATSTIDVQAQAAEGRSTADLVARAPGVVVRDYGGPGQLATLSLRGASAQQCLVLLDGVPITGATSGLVNLQTLPPAFLERIEVIRGVVGPIYGPGALGGAVNLVSRTPRPGPPALDAEIRGGSFGTGEARLAGSASAGPGALLVSLDALGSRGDFGYRAIDARVDTPRTNNDAQQLSGIVRYAQPLGAHTALDLTAQAESGSRGLAGPMQNPSPLDHLDDARLLAHLRLTQALDAGTFELRTFARQDRLSVSLGGAPATPELDALGGAEARFATRVGHHGLSALVHAAGEQLSVGETVHARPELGVGLVDEWLLWDGRLSLLPAARVDRVEGFSGVSPQLGAVLRPVEGLELRGTVGQTFRAPTFSELYLDQGLVTSNPDLGSERALGADLGASLELGRVRVSAGGFVTEYVDLIEYELFPPFRAKPFNVGTALVDGAEGELSVRPRPELELALSYTWQTSADLHDDVRYYLHELAYHPHHRGGARAAWSSSRISAHLETFAQSSQYLSRANTAALSGRVETGAGLAVRPLADQPLWVGLEAQNLLDQRSQDLYGYPLPGRALYALLRIAAPAPEHP